jgi:lipid II:glycine glycyltransferase (peptidoglycan interpeptide bridge formation enzyme)
MIAIEPADPAFLNGAPSFLQTGWWAAFKSKHGWSSLAFQIVEPGQANKPLSVLIRRLPLGMALAYVPHPDVAPDQLQALSLALRPHLPKGTVSVRWDLVTGTRVSPTAAGSDDDEAPVEDPFPAPLPKPFRKPAADVQPPDTVIVALGDDESMLARMHKKTRYNIRLAEKKGVVVERAGVEALSLWYALYRQTADRDKIAIHSEQYYRDLFGLAPDLTLWLAKYDGQVLAGNIVLVHGKTATYLYGASGNEHRNLMAPYALQWAALTAVRNQGCTEYDLFGIPPTNDPHHPMHGLYRFKNGFGGHRIHRSGAWDYVYRPVEWTAWTRADALRVWYYKVWKKR